MIMTIISSMRINAATQTMIIVDVLMLLSAVVGIGEDAVTESTPEASVNCTKILLFFITDCRRAVKGVVGRCNGKHSRNITALYSSLFTIIDSTEQEIEERNLTT